MGRNSNKLETSKLKLYNKAFAKGIDNIRIVLGKVSLKTFYPSKPFPLFIQCIPSEERVVYHLNDMKGQEHSGEWCQVWLKLVSWFFRRSTYIADSLAISFLPMDT